MSFDDHHESILIDTRLRWFSWNLCACILSIDSTPELRPQPFNKSFHVIFLLLEMRRFPKSPHINLCSDFEIFTISWVINDYTKMWLKSPWCCFHSMLSLCSCASSGFLCITWGPVHQLGSCAFSGFLSFSGVLCITWVPVHHLGSCASPGFLCIAWVAVHYLGSCALPGFLSIEAEPSGDSLVLVGRAWGRSSPWGPALKPLLSPGRCPWSGWSW